LNNENILNYEDPIEYYGYPRIQSHLIENDILEIFIPYDARIDKIIDSFCVNNADSLTTKKIISNEQKLNCINQFYQLNIDNKKLNSTLSFFKHQLDSQKGFYTISSISELEIGKHYLHISLNEQFNLKNIGVYEIMNRTELDDRGNKKIVASFHIMGMSPTLEIFDVEVDKGHYYSIKIPFYKK